MQLNYNDFFLQMSVQSYMHKCHTYQSSSGQVRGQCVAQGHVDSGEMPTELLIL